MDLRAFPFRAQIQLCNEIFKYHMQQLFQNQHKLRALKKNKDDKTHTYATCHKSNDVIHTLQTYEQIKSYILYKNIVFNLHSEVTLSRFGQPDKL